MLIIHVSNYITSMKWFKSYADNTEQILNTIDLLLHIRYIYFKNKYLNICDDYINSKLCYINYAIESIDSCE
jgi:hypothetical protein